MRFGIPKQNFPKSIWAALASISIVHIGAYIIVPILPIVLKVDKGLTTSQVGVVVGAASFSLQIGSMMAGFISDRAGRRSALALGSMILCLSVLGLGFSSQYILLVLSSLLNGIGSGIFAPTAKAAISALASQEHQTTAFSLRGIAANLGTSLGGLGAMVLALRATEISFIASAVIYAALVFISLVLLPKGCEGQPCPKIPLSEYGQILKNSKFVVFTLLSFLTWLIFAQFGLLLPLRAQVILKQPKKVALVWTIMSIAVILIQSLINKYILKKLSPIISLSLGVGVISLSVLLIGFASNFNFLIVIALVFALGEMLFMPTTDSITSTLSSPKLLAAYFSIANIAAGTGAAVGSYLGGRLIENYGIMGSSIPWIIFAGYGIITSIIIVGTGSKLVSKG